MSTVPEWPNQVSLTWPKQCLNQVAKRGILKARFPHVWFEDICKKEDCDFFPKYVWVKAEIRKKWCSFITLLGEVCYEGWFFSLKDLFAKYDNGALLNQFMPIFLGQNRLVLRDCDFVEFENSHPIEVLQKTKTGGVLKHFWHSLLGKTYQLLRPLMGGLRKEVCTKRSKWSRFVALLTSFICQNRFRL